LIVTIKRKIYLLVARTSTIIMTNKTKSIALVIIAAMVMTLGAAGLATASTGNQTGLQPGLGLKKLQRDVMPLSSAKICPTADVDVTYYNPITGETQHLLAEDAQLQWDEDAQRCVYVGICLGAPEPGGGSCDIRESTIECPSIGPRGQIALEWDSQLGRCTSPLFSSPAVP
jgi:hypothetical protein